MSSSIPEQPVTSYRETTGRIPTPPNLPPSTKPKIDPNQIPSPVSVQALDEQHYARRDYSTMSRDIPPLATTNFTAIDYGNCNPRYMRSTLYNVPMSGEMLNSSRLPFGILSQPLANPKDTEASE
jgi:protein transport protein SEC24